MQRRETIAGALLTVCVHVGWVILFATAPAPAPAEEQSGPRVILCGGMRCPMLPMGTKRRDNEPANEEMNVLEAMVIPRLGMMKKPPKSLPRIQKYEQPEKAEVAVNISKPTPKKPKVVPKAKKKKKAEIDPKRKEPPKSLKALLNAPEDNDPRARATSLRRIIGHSKGSVSGTGTELKAGSIYMAKVGMAVRREFAAPSALTDEQLRKLKAKVLVTEIADNGAIRRYRFVSRSGNRLFDGAALAAVKRFVPSEGGSKRLPSPDVQTAALIRKKGFLIVLDGRRL